LNWGEQTLIPRFLHFFIASMAVGGLFIASVGLFRWRQDTEYARFLIKFGGRWFMYVTMLQIAAGLWFLISLPREKMMLFMGDNVLATVALLIGVVGALAAIFFMSETLRKDDPRQGFHLVAGLTAGVIIFMAIIAGTRTSSLIYDAFLLLAYLSIILGVFLAYLPTFCLLGLITVVIAVPVFLGAYRYGNDMQKLVPYMGLNVIINLATPVLVAIGFFGRVIE
jgi:hypothetical protein